MLIGVFVRFGPDPFFSFLFFPFPFPFVAVKASELIVEVDSTSGGGDDDHAHDTNTRRAETRTHDQCMFKHADSLSFDRLFGVAAACHSAAGDAILRSQPGTCRTTKASIATVDTCGRESIGIAFTEATR